MKPDAGSTLLNNSLIRCPSAVIPLVMSGVALATVLAHMMNLGVVHATDDETAAHLFQLLIAGQAPFAAFFALRWLPRYPSQAMFILGLQAAAALVALAPVVIFDL